MPLTFDQKIKLVLDAEQFERDYAATLLGLQAALPGMPAADVERYAEQLGFNKMPKEQKQGGLGAMALQGGVAGVAAGLTIKLIEEIQGWVKQSKILSMFMDTVGKAFGLLIDLILLPFLPILIWILIRLFQSVMWFGKVWKEYVDKLVVALTPKGLVEALTGKDTTEYTQEDLVSIILSILGGIFVGVAAGIGAALLGLTVGWAVVAGVIVGLIVAGIIYYLTPKAYELGKQFGAWVVQHGKDFAQWVEDMRLKLLLFENDLRSKISQFFLDVGKWFDAHISQPIKDAMDWINARIEETMTFLQVFADTIVLGFKRILWHILTYLKQIPIVGGWAPDAGEYPQAASGGRVAKTGLAVIHKGEDIIPGGAGVTVNIYGTYQNDEDLYRKFIDRMRRDQWRQNV